MPLLPKHSSVIPIQHNQDQVRLDRTRDRILTMINTGERSREMYTFAKKNMPNKVCLSPFVTANIDISGEVRLCNCGGWMWTNVGNLFLNTMKEILSSREAQLIRGSIADGSYLYCNEKTCGVINNNELNDRHDPHGVPPRVQECLEDPTRFYMPTEIILAGDITCNLSCPSCRNSVIKVDDESLELYQDLGNKIRQNLFSEPTDDPMRLMLSTSGELFASPMLLQMVNTISVQDYPNLRLVLQSNGLLAPARWHRLGDMQDRVDSIVVTVDAARPETYEQLRRGGRWEDILSALEWLSDKKRENNMDFVIRMIVQQANYQEMEEFWHLGQQLGVDHVEYGRILNWQTYIEDNDDHFHKHDVFDPQHPEHKSAQHMLAHMKGFPRAKFWGGL